MRRTYTPLADRESVARVAVAAQDLLRQHGWHQGTQPTPELTLFEALKCAATGQYPPPDAMTDEQLRLYRFVKDECLRITGTWTLTEWNNAPGRTVDDVLKLLGDAAYVVSRGAHVGDEEL